VDDEEKLLELAELLHGHAAGGVQRAQFQRQPLLATWPRALRTRPTRTLSRYEAGEHAQFGDTEIVCVNGVPISRGNVIALGDFFRTPEDMARADPEVLRKLDAATTQDRRARTGEKDPVTGEVPKAPTDAELQEITKPLGKGSTYMDLNKENEAHFAPPKEGASPAGKDNKSAFAKFHRQALDEAHEDATGGEAGGQAPGGTPAPTVKPKPSPRSVATNMFATHFVTDALSAGHLINKQEVLDQAKQSWAKLSAADHQTFTLEVSRRTLENSEVAGKIDGVEMKNLHTVGTAAAVGGVVGGIAGAIAGAGPLSPLIGGLAGVAGAAVGGAIGWWLADYVPVTKERLSELLNLTSRLDADTFFNIFVKMVHDKLNRTGVEVTNGEDTWTLPGDKTLNPDASGKTPDPQGKTLEVGQKAVAAAATNLTEAAETPGPLQFDEMIQRVWKFVPHPTKGGQEVVDKARAELTNATNDKAIDAAVTMSIEGIDTGIDELIEKGIFRRKGGAPAATPSGAGSAPASGGSCQPETPSFTPPPPAEPVGR
jgi:hypothetical protein